MRETHLILVGSPCDANLYSDGPEKLAEIARDGRSLCPHFEKCNEPGFLDEHRAHQCVMLLGLQTARASLTQEVSIASLMEAYSSDIPNPPEGFVYSVDRKEFTIISRPEALVKIAEFARTIIGGSDGPQDNPCVLDKPPAKKLASHMRYDPRKDSDPVGDFLGSLE